MHTYLFCIDFDHAYTYRHRSIELNQLNALRLCMCSTYMHRTDSISTNTYIHVRTLTSVILMHFAS